jgi:ATP-dependent DNA helicase RecG
MNKETVRQLIAGGESSTVEFKVNAPRPTELAERMCGMANTRTGGVIIFGVGDENRSIVGVNQANDTIDTILRAARMVKPPIMLSDESINTWSLDGHAVVTAKIPANDGRLYQYNGACLVRRGTFTVPLSIEEIWAYLNATGTTRWELGICEGITLDDLDMDAVERYLAYRAEQGRRRRRYVAPADLLVGLRAATHGEQQSAVQPTNAGILMFGFDPQLPLPQSEVVCVKYADALGVGSYIDRKNLRGPLPQLIDQASTFLRQYIRVGATIRGFKREDEPEYPYEALREAVVNAIVHRDYSRIGETVRVFMYADRVEVRSPGGLMPGITVDDLLNLRVTSIPRNPVLAGFLRDVPGYMERIGSGIRFMMSEMRALGLPDPEFIEHQDFTVTFRNGTPESASADLNERQQLGLQIVRERGSISTGEYCSATGVAERTGLRDLQELVTKGLLVARGKKRGSRYFLP